MPGSPTLPVTGASSGPSIDQERIHLATVGAVSYSAMIAALTRCPNKCPAMGGSATLSGGGKSATVSYDGTNKAKYTLGDGTSGTITLPCTL